MTGRFLLDTNIVVALFKDDPAVRRALSQRPEVMIPSVVLGELYYGAQKSAMADKNLQRINRFLTEAAVIECNAATAYEYGLIKNELRREGLPIPENDLWIAAVARQHELVLVSRDAHFDSVDGLNRETW